jgi:hypothetical protein
MLKVTATKNKTKIGDLEGVVTQGCVNDVCVSQNGEKLSGTLMSGEDSKTGNLKKY